MRNDERYRPKPQSNQLEIFGLGIANNLMFDATHPDNNDGETAANAYHVMIALCEAGLSRIDEKCVAKSREFIADKIKPVSEEEREFGRAFLAAVLGIK